LALWGFFWFGFTHTIRTCALIRNIYLESPVEFMLILVLIGFIVWMFYVSNIKPAYIQKLKPAQSMGETELEEVLILQRAIAITTNAYDEASKFEAASLRCKEILHTLLMRHESHILNAMSTDKAFKFWFIYNESYGHYAINNFDYESENNETLLALALIAYNGWFISGLGTINQDKDICLTLTDYLLLDRKYEKAFLLKGIILKYGIYISCKPNVTEAKNHFQAAVDSGVGTAIKELIFIEQYRALECLKYNQGSETTWESVSRYSRRSNNS
jgi:hypothetical protein